MVAALVRAEQLPAAERFQLKLERADVQAFIEEKMLTAEIAVRTGLACKCVPDHMAKLGVEPIASVSQGRGFVWPRHAVEAVLGAPRRGNRDPVM